MKVNGQQIINEQDCPLLTKSKHLLSVPSSDILSPVSIVHECTSCRLETKRKRQKIERESIDIDTLVLAHNYKTNNFALNIYCMNNPYIV